METMSRRVALKLNHLCKFTLSLFPFVYQCIPLLQYKNSSYDWIAEVLDLGHSRNLFILTSCHIALHRPQTTYFGIAPLSMYAIDAHRSPAARNVKQKQELPCCLSCHASATNMQQEIKHAAAYHKHNIRFINVAFC